MSQSWSLPGDARTAATLSADARATFLGRTYATLFGAILAAALSLFASVALMFWYVLRLFMGSRS